MIEIVRIMTIKITFLLRMVVLNKDSQYWVAMLY